jgi:outer membrane protein assembly factor BamA
MIRASAAALAALMAMSLPGLARASETSISSTNVMDEADKVSPTDEEGKRKPGFVVLPIPLSNPALGSGLVLAGVSFYQPEGSPRPWMTGAGVLWTDNGSMGGGVFQKAYLGGDKYRISGFAGGANLNLNFYGIGAADADRDFSIPINQNGRVVKIDGFRKVYENTYVGLRLRMATITTSFRFDGEPPEEFEDLALELDSDIGGPGLLAQYDTRDSELWPSTGTYANLQAQWDLDSFGSEYIYDKQELTYNRYMSLTDSGVLAVRGSLCRAGDGTPFFDLCMFGASNDLRGYETGQYRDRALAAVQAEYRWRFSPRWGAVFFAGVGSVAPSLGDLTDSVTLPSGGAGLRFRASKAYNVNISLDYAVGRDSEALYFYIGEAF